jgi:hypothetical protein
LEPEVIFGSWRKAKKKQRKKGFVATKMLESGLSLSAVIASKRQQMTGWL